MEVLWTQKSRQNPTPIFLRQFWLLHLRGNVQKVTCSKLNKKLWKMWYFEDFGSVFFYNLTKLTFSDQKNVKKSIFWKFGRVFFYNLTKIHFFCLNHQNFKNYKIQIWSKNCQNEDDEQKIWKMWYFEDFVCFFFYNLTKLTFSDQKNVKKWIFWKFWLCFLL